MKSMVQLFGLGAAGVALGLPLMAGCTSAEEGADDAELASSPEGTGLEETEETGTLEEGLTSVDMVDCSICATARACCNVVSGGSSYCFTFNADRCATLDPGRQRTTKGNCLVLLRATIHAWEVGGRNPPPECHIPGE